MDNNLERIYLEKIGRGDIRSFDAIFMHYQPKLVCFINGFIKNNEEARDISQDIFFKIWTNRTSVATILSFKSYLFQMARYAIYDYYDHSTVVKKYEEKAIYSSEIEDNIESHIHAKELQQSIDFAIDRMPPQRKAIITLSRKEGMSNDEIAIKLNVSKRTVENQISLALTTLRKITQLVNLFFL